MLKMLKVSKLATGLGKATISRKASRDSMDQHIGSRILGGEPIFPAVAVRIRGSHSFRDAGIPVSLKGIIKSKKSAEWWNVINDKNRQWADSPNQQKSQTQPDYDLVHITSMRKTRTRLIVSH